jgi:hypothetical protein
MHELIVVGVLGGTGCDVLGLFIDDDGICLLADSMLSDFRLSCSDIRPKPVEETHDYARRKERDEKDKIRLDGRTASNIPRPMEKIFSPILV